MVESGGDVKGCEHSEETGAGVPVARCHSARHEAWFG